jgi:uncharacterized RmlC-like cupin family protein
MDSRLEARLRHEVRGAGHRGAICVVKGRACMRWGEKLECTADVGMHGRRGTCSALPQVPHREINASATEVLECGLCRSDGQAVAVNLNVEPGEKPER